MKWPSSSWRGDRKRDRCFFTYENTFGGIVIIIVFTTASKSFRIALGKVERCERRFIELIIWVSQIQILRQILFANRSSCWCCLTHHHPSFVCSFFRLSVCHKSLNYLQSEMSLGSKDELELKSATIRATQSLLKWLRDRLQFKKRKPTDRPIRPIRSAC